MEEALARNQTRYAPSSGIPELRRAILEKVRRRNGIPADDESPIVVNGGMHGLFAAFATLLDPGDEVLMFSPYWTPIVDVITWNGGVPVLVPTERARAKGICRDARRGASRRARRSSTGTPRTIRPATSSRARGRGGLRVRRGAAASR